MKVYRLTYWFTTMTLAAFMGLSVIMYFANYEEISQTFVRLGFPAWLVYPLGIAKVVAVVVLIAMRNRAFAIWAYAGLAFDFIMAIIAHIIAGDDLNGTMPPVVALIVLFVSYFTRSVVGRDNLAPNKKEERDLTA